MQLKWVALAVVCTMALVQVTWAGSKGEDTIIIGGEHGCGPKLIYKSGGKKKGDIILMNDCKEKHEEQQYHYIPYPIYHHGYSNHGGY